MNAFKRFLKDEDGATAIEYGLIVALISIVGIASMSTLGTELTGLWSSAASAVENR